MEMQILIPVSDGKLKQRAKYRDFHGLPTPLPVFIFPFLSGPCSLKGKLRLLVKILSLSSHSGSGPGSIRSALLLDQLTGEQVRPVVLKLGLHWRPQWPRSGSAHIPWPRAVGTPRWTVSDIQGDLEKLLPSPGLNLVSSDFPPS